MKGFFYLPQQLMLISRLITEAKGVAFTSRILQISNEWWTE